MAINIIKYYLQSSIVKELDQYMGVRKHDKIYWVNFDGLIYRKHLPACIEFQCGLIIKSWIINGFYYNTFDGPTQIVFLKNGQIFIEHWHDKDGFLHRASDQPAKIVYNNNGKITNVGWFQHGYLHRLEGPSLVRYYDDGRVQYECWTRNGDPLSQW